MRTPVPYYGGKQVIAESVVKLLPPHDHYVEPFFGSGAVLFAKPPSAMETVNDIDDQLVTFWRVLRCRLPELTEACALTPHSRTEHQAAFQPASDDVEVARRVFVRLTQGRTGTLQRTGWRYQRPAGGARLPREIANRIGGFAAVAERLANVSLECRPALDVIADYGSEPTALLYVDPPYLGETRNGVGRYRHEMPDRREHRALAEALHAARAAVVISGYPSDLYDVDLYPEWSRHEIATYTPQGGAAKTTTEVLWSNRPFVEGTLFDFMEAS